MPPAISRSAHHLAAAASLCMKKGGISKCGLLPSASLARRGNRIS